MKTFRIGILGAPAHAVLNDLPAALMPAASICDLVSLLGGGRSWAMTAYRLLQLGNLGAVVAAAAGALDFLRLPRDPEVRATGQLHAMMNGVLLPMFLAAQRQRSRDPYRPSVGRALILLLLNVGLVTSSSMGQRLVYRSHVGVGENLPDTLISAELQDVTWGGEGMPVDLAERARQMSQETTGQA